MEDGVIRDWSIALTSPKPTESAANVMRMLLAKTNLAPKDVSYTVATGYGRINVPFAQSSVTEISCHARGSHWLFPKVRTILDMGGQDCKAIKCDENGMVTNFAMNDKCAAGTGRYLERIADTLKLTLDQIGPLSLNEISERLSITNTCAVFAEGEVIRLLREGKHRNDILAAATEAIVDQVNALLQRIGVEEGLCVSGGIAKNIGVVKRLERRLGLKVCIAPEPQIVGALGAALFASDKCNTQALE